MIAESESPDIKGHSDITFPFERRPKDWTDGRNGFNVLGPLARSSSLCGSIRISHQIDIDRSGEFCVYHLIAFSLRRRAWRNKHMNNHKTCQSHDFLYLQMHSTLKVTIVAWQWRKVFRHNNEAQLNGPSFLPKCCQPFQSTSHRVRKPGNTA